MKRRGLTGVQRTAAPLLRLSQSIKGNSKRGWLLHGALWKITMANISSLSALGIQVVILPIYSILSIHTFSTSITSMAGSNSINRVPVICLGRKTGTTTQSTAVPNIPPTKLKGNNFIVFFNIANKVSNCAWQHSTDLSTELFLTFLRYNFANVISPNVYHQSRLWHYQQLSCALSLYRQTGGGCLLLQLCFWLQLALWPVWQFCGVGETKVREHTKTLCGLDFLFKHQQIKSTFFFTGRKTHATENVSINKKYLIKC